VIDRNGHTNAVGNASPQVRASTGFTFIALLMLRHNVDQEIISTINVFLQQALIIAENCRLLLPVDVNTDRLSPLKGMFHKRYQRHSLISFLDVNRMGD
jgi:hypothetical protein